MRALAPLIVLALSGCILEVPLDDKRCDGSHDCLPGYVCEANTCVQLHLGEGEGAAGEGEGAAGEGEGAEGEGAAGEGEGGEGEGASEGEGAEGEGAGGEGEGAAGEGEGAEGEGEGGEGEGAAGEGEGGAGEGEGGAGEGEGEGEGGAGEGEGEGGVDVSDCVPSADARYVVCTTPRTFDEGHAACAALGGDLATVTSDDENEVVRAAVDQASAPETWIGLSDAVVEGDFHWVTGEPYVEQDFWDAGEPNNDGNENCVEVYEDGTWNDLACDDVIATLCEIPGVVEAPGSCLDPHPLSVGDNPGNTTGSPTLIDPYQVCAENGVARGDAWRFDAPRTGVLHVDVTSALDVAVYARQDLCESSGFNMRDCVDDFDVGGVEHVDLPVKLGEPVFVFVASFSGDGAYVITTSFGDPVCGDGVVNTPGESCDDGGTSSGDGCSATCTLEGTVSESEPNDNALQPDLITLSGAAGTIRTARGALPAAADVDTYEIDNPTASDIDDVSFEVFSDQIGECHLGRDPEDPAITIEDAAGNTLDDDDDASPAGWCPLLDGSHHINVPAHGHVFALVHPCCGTTVPSYLLAVTH